MNTGEPSRDVKESEKVGTKEPMNPPMTMKDVRVAIVLRAWENRAQGEGPQHVGVSDAIYLNVNAEVHLMNVREKLKRLSQIDEETYSAEAVCGESRTHGFNGGDGETGFEPRSVPTHCSGRHNHRAECKAPHWN